MKQEITLDYSLKKQQVALSNAGVSGIRCLINEINLQAVNHEPASYYYTVKRIIDIIVSTMFILLIMSWLTPLIALLIKMSSDGPVFFIQKRTGFMGLEFNCIKFRTMYVNDESDIKQVSINDKRITAIGKILRITHLDETPQFFNVIMGDMSVVGPRPHMVYHTQYYSECIPYYNLRHQVYPGMTGMAQVKDYIGEINVERELRKRIQWDIYYMKNRSIWLDIKILFTTAGGVLVKTFNIFSRK